MWKSCLFLALTMCLIANVQVGNALASRKKDRIDPLWLLLLFSGMMNNNRNNQHREYNC